LKWIIFSIPTIFKNSKIVVICRHFRRKWSLFPYSLISAVDIIMDNLLKSCFFLDVPPMVCECGDIEEIIYKNRDNKKILKSIGFGTFLIGKFPGMISSIYAAAPSGWLERGALPG
jgi:hypothetical protein